MKDRPCGWGEDFARIHPTVVHGREWRAHDGRICDGLSIAITTVEFFVTRSGRDRPPRIVVVGIAHTVVKREGIGVTIYNPMVMPSVLPPC